MDITTGNILAAGIIAGAAEDSAKKVSEELRKQNEALEAKLKRDTELKEQREKALRLRTCINKNDIIKTYIRDDYFKVTRVHLELKVLDKAKKVNELGQAMYLVTVNNEKTGNFFTAQIHPKIWNIIDVDDSLYFDDVYEEVVEVDEEKKKLIEECRAQKATVFLLINKRADLIETRADIGHKIDRYNNKAKYKKMLRNRILLGAFASILLLTAIVLLILLIGDGVSEVGANITKAREIALILMRVAFVAWSLVSLIFAVLINLVDYEALSMTIEDYNKIKEEHALLDSKIEVLGKQIDDEEAKLKQYERIISTIEYEVK